ncbi:hypothetical protein AVEN_255008-1 [Araneus ventricosus]|uniref:Uncharacterized protein n=1 Tax=Araneus ventricosus TaxID=182803 RepID=A0A4Y2LJ45_ARAVE|nr:hypothetical protein AVEN_100248-1 [Araneus ventricosus]GBO03915.1 hypothetical protein AVEN_255008-1 [Araneus ventricosus]
MKSAPAQPPSLAKTSRNPSFQNPYLNSIIPPLVSTWQKQNAEGFVPLLFNNKDRGVRLLEEKGTTSSLGPSNSSGVEVQEFESVSISVARGILKMDGLLAGDLVPPTRLGREEGLMAGDMARWPLTILYLMGMEVEM